MTHEEVKILLNDYFDEKLSIEVNTEIQVHLSECDECSQYLFSLQSLMKKADLLPRNIKPPADFWQDIFISLSDLKIESIKHKEELDFQEAVKLSEEESLKEKKRRDERSKAEKLLAWEKQKTVILQNFKNPLFRKILIGVVSFLALFIIYKSFLSKGESWEVKKSRISSTNFSESFGNLEEDQLLETNSITRLEIQVPKIGRIFLEPDSKIKRLQANKIQLLQGSISAAKDGAKERLSIEVPGAEINDHYLGGNLKVTVTNSKVSLLEVVDGWVSFKDEYLESIVLANHMCKVIANSGFGLPYRNGTSQDLINAIDEYCFTNLGNEEALISILTKADVKNTLTVWNLMKRVTRKQRDMVIYTMFGLLGNPPEGVTVDGLKTLDPQMLQKLLEEIELKIQ